MHLIIMALSFFDYSLSNPERLNVPQTSWKNISDIFEESSHVYGFGVQ